MIELVKQLREETGVSIAKCKEALDQAHGDIEKAREILRQFSVAAAEKKADRDLGAGTVAQYVHSNKQMGVLISLLCETDFVAKNEDFIALATDIALHSAGMGSEIDTIKDEPFIKDGERTVGDIINSASQKLGERIEIGTIARVSISA